MGRLPLEIPLYPLPRESLAFPLSGFLALSFWRTKIIEIKLKLFSLLSPYLLWDTDDADNCAARYFCAPNHGQQMILNKSDVAG